MSVRMCRWVVALLIFVVSSHISGADETLSITPVPPTLGRPVDFSQDLLPVLRAKCLACHSRSKHEGGLVLETAGSIVSGGDTGPGLVAGKPDESLLFQLAAHRDDPRMPPPDNKVNATPLTPAELGLMGQWITEGGTAGSSVASSINWRSVPHNIQPVYSLALDDAERLLAVGRGNRISLIDLPLRRELGGLSNPLVSDLPQVAQRDFVHSLAFSPDGTLLAAGGYRVINLWRRMDPLRQRLIAPTSVTSIAVSADGLHRAAGLQDGSIAKWDSGGISRVVIQMHSGRVNALAFNNDHSLLVTGSQNGDIGIVNLVEGTGFIAVPTPSPVTALLLDETHGHIITGHEDGSVRTTQLALVTGDTTNLVLGEGTPVRDLKCHNEAVSALQLLPIQPPRLVTSSADGTARIWQLDEGREIARIEHGPPIKDLALSGDGTTLITLGGEAGQVRLWKAEGEGFKQVHESQGNPRLGRVQQRLREDVEVAQARKADSAAHVALVEKDLAEREASLKKAIEQLEAARKALGEAELKTAQATQKIDSVTAQSTESPTDEARQKEKAEAETQLQAARDLQATAQMAVTSAEREVEFSQRSTELVRSSKQQAESDLALRIQRDQQARDVLKASEEGMTQHPVSLTAVTFLHDGSVFATGSDDGTITLWQTESCRPLEHFDHADGAVTSMASDSEGQLLAGGMMGTLTVWATTPEWRFGQQLGPTNPQGQNLDSSPIAGRVLSVAFSPDGKTLATGSGVESRSGQVSLWDVPNGKPLQIIDDAHSDTVGDVSFSHDGELLLTGSADRLAKVFSLSDGGLLKTFEGHTGHVLGVAWRADNSQIATAGADNAIKVWDARTGEQQRTISTHSKPVTSLCYVGLTDQIVTGSGDQTVRLHRTGDGNNLRTFGGAGEFVHCVLVTRDGTLVASGTQAGLVRLWDGASGTLLAMFEPAPAVAADSTLHAVTPETGKP